jgi:hypothetical protein
MATPSEEPPLSAEQRRALKLPARIPGGGAEATGRTPTCRARNGDNGVYQGRRPGAIVRCGVGGGLLPKDILGGKSGTA